jgi:hypothetical protein
MAESTPESDNQDSGLGGSDNTDEDVEVAQTSVSESGADPEGYFDDIDESAGVDGGSEAFSFDDDDEGSDSESSSSSGSASPQLANSINQGVARAAVIGLDDEWETDSGSMTKDELQTEFEETFEAFRLGHYASEVAEEYLLVEEDIHPAWGLLGASLVCAAVIVYRRPDGDEFVQEAKNRLGSIPGEITMPENLPTGGE